MPSKKGASTPVRTRGPYKPACDLCGKRKSKCGGEPGLICAPCRHSGRGPMCTWESFFARRSRGENLVAHPPKQTEAFHNLLIQYHAYSCKLETLLDHYVQTYPLPQPKDFRLERPKDPDDLLGLSLSIGEFHLEEDEVECDELENPTNILLWHDLPTLVEGYYGISSPFRFRSDPLPVPSRFPAIAKDPDVTYVLMIGDDTNFNPHFDWSRYLPSAVALDRGSHDRALDALFRYCTSFCLRIIPDLFLKAMYRVLSVPRSQEPPKTAHYSPMLHNAIVALALAFSDDPRFRDLKARQYFIDAAKNHMEAECQKPTLAVVQALSFLGTFYGSQGDQGLGFMYFGLSARVAQALGLNLDCSDYVERGLMEHSDQIDRNWTTWSIFTSDVCWSLYVGREFATSLPDDDFPLPYIDTALDEMPVVYGNLAPQPNQTTKTFHANAELFVIARDILEVNNTLSKTKARPIVVFDRVDYVDTKLTDWCASLPPDLQLTVEARSTASPHKLLLHLSYWWLFVLLHRPLFHSRTSTKAGRQIDHIKLCKRAADNIMEILKTWHDLFGLRFCPITLIQIAFSAGSVYLLLAVQACSTVPVAKREVDHSIAQQKLVVEYLHEIGRSWPGANKIVEILRDLVQKKLTPLLDTIPVRDGEVPEIQDEYPPAVPGSPSRNRGRVQHGHRTSRKTKKSPSGQWRGGSGGPMSILPQPLASFPSPTTSIPPKQSPTIPIPNHRRSDSNGSGFVMVGSPGASDAGTSTTSSSGPRSEVATINASTSYDHSMFQLEFPLSSAIPPQALHYGSTPPMEGYVGQTDSQAPQFMPSTWPDKGFVGMPEGQTLPDAPFWNQISIADPTSPWLTTFDNFLTNHSFVSGGPSDQFNTEMDTEVSMDERNNWCQTVNQLN